MPCMYAIIWHLVFTWGPQIIKFSIGWNHKCTVVPLGVRSGNSHDAQIINHIRASTMTSHTIIVKIRQQLLGKHCHLAGFTCFLQGFGSCLHSFYSHARLWLFCIIYNIKFLCPFVCVPLFCRTAGPTMNKFGVTLNRLRCGQARCAESLYRWGVIASPACPCGESHQTTRHIVEECPLTAFPGGLRRLHEAGPDAVEWLSKLSMKLWECSKRTTTTTLGPLYEACT